MELRKKRTIRKPNRLRGIPKEDLKDLGFGSRVTRETRLRLLNRDGSFNVLRTGLSSIQTLHLYHSLLTMPWWRFHLIVAIVFVGINFLFALAFVAVGMDSINGATALSLSGKLLEAFFFSVQTFTTVGYGHLTPNGLAGNLVASAAALVGLMSFALVTGLLFARFSRPSVKLLFSEKAIIAPYQGAKAFEFRFANARSNELSNVSVKVLYSDKASKAQRGRRFRELGLERKEVAFLPLHLTVVHPVDERSPLDGLSAKDLKKADAEFIVLISAYDETFAQTVHSRTSYKYDEVVWHATFCDMFNPLENGFVSVDLRAIHNYEMVDGSKSET